MIFLIVLFSAAIFAMDPPAKLHRAFIEDFKKGKLKNFRYGSSSGQDKTKWQSGAVSQEEPGTDILSFIIGPNDSAGAGRGPEIISKNLTHFGTYAARLKVPDVQSIQPNVGVVVGYFTYNMDRSGPGLSEIDWEWLIADPRIIYIGTWTGRRDSLKRIGRTVNMAEGTILNTNFRIGHQGRRSPLTGLQNQPETIPMIEGYDASKHFYTYGFDWFPDRLRWWMINPANSDTVVLWDYQGSQVGIPPNASRYRMNFWHTKDWSVEGNPASIERPTQNYELEVDWMSYKPMGEL